MKKLFYVLLCFFPTAVVAQDWLEYSPTKAIFQLTNAEARVLLVDGTPVDSSFLHTLVTSVAATDPTAVLPDFYAGLKSGYYAVVSAQGDALEVEILTKPAFELRLFNNNRDFTFSIVDSTGTPIRDAVVLWEGQIMPFDPKTEAYRRQQPPKARSGTLTVTALGMTQYYNVTHDAAKIHHYRLRNLSRFKWAKPLIKTLNFAAAFRVHSERFRHPWRGLKKTWREPALRDQTTPEFRGYSAFSKPLYRPGDTIELKMWITDENGKPWKKAVELTVKEEGNSKQWQQTNLTPVRPGVFVTKLVVEKGMPIDKNYYFYCSELNPAQGTAKRQMIAQVRVEDYRLDQIKYQFNLDKKEAYRGDTLLFTLSAKDLNGQSIADGTYRLTLLAQELTQVHTDSCFVPDTLWQQNGVVEINGDTKIKFNTAQLPPVSMTYGAHMECLTASGELQKFSLSGNYLHEPRTLSAQVLGKYLLIDWPDSVSRPATCTVKSTFSVVPSRTQVYALPVRLPISGYEQHFDIEAGDKSLQVTNPRPTAAANAFWRTDTACFELANPYQAAVRYFIFSGKDLIDEGVFTEENWRWQRVFHHKKPLELRYNFPNNSDYSIKLYERSNKLDVHIIAAPQVEPGEIAQVEIQVRNQRQKAVANAELTAGAFNAAFTHNGARLPFTGPVVKAQHLPFAPISGKYAAYLYNRLGKPRRIALFPAIYPILRLDTIPFYQLRNLSVRPIKAMSARQPIPADDLGPSDTSSLVRHYHTDWRRRTQFAPYIFENGRSVAVEMIWLDNRLIYYAGTTHPVPYSFTASSGRHQIKIRTATGLYTLVNVLFEEDQKHLIALEAKGWAAETKLEITGINGDSCLQNAVLRYYPMTAATTEKEQQDLANSLLLLRGFIRSKGTHHLLQDYRGAVQVHQEYGNQPVVYGPFTTYYPLIVMSNGQVWTNFHFTPGFIYELEPRRERLYATDMVKKITEIPARPAQFTTNEWAIRATRLGKAQSLEKYILVSNFFNPSAEKGKLKIDWVGEWKKIGYIILHDDKVRGQFESLPNPLIGLKGGNYQLLIYKDVNQYRVVPFTIKPFTTTYLKLVQNDSFVTPPSQFAFDKVFGKYTYEGLDKMEQTWQPKYERKGNQTTKTGIIVHLVDAETGEDLIGASVTVIQLSNQTAKGGVTDVLGRFQVSVGPGTYSVSVGYTGYSPLRVIQVTVQSDNFSVVDAAMYTSNNYLSEVVVTGYSVGLIRQDQTSSAKTYTGEGIWPLSTRSVHSMEMNLIQPGRTQEILQEELLTGVNRPQEPPISGVRTHFQDFVYFQPTLRTDRDGKAVFRVKYPDDITRWTHYAIATKPGDKGGYVYAQTRSAKALTAQLAVPRFALTGDQFTASATTTNRSGDTLALRSQFRVNGQALRERPLRVGFGVTERLPIQVPEGDSLTVEYQVFNGEITDGEQRKVPISPVGIVVQDAKFAILLRDSSVQWPFDSNGGPITVRVENNVFKWLYEGVDYLRTYPHGCNEQTSSRLISLLLYKKIREKRGLPFTDDEWVREGIQRLHSSYRDGSWGWFANDQSSIWITCYVLKALHMAQKEGYDIPNYDQAYRSLREQLPTMKLETVFEAYDIIAPTLSTADCKKLLDQTQIRYQKTNANSDWIAVNLIRMRQNCGQPVHRDSLLQYLVLTPDGGLTSRQASDSWYERKNSINYVAYQIAKQAGWRDILDKIEREWLIITLNNGTTFDRALILCELVQSSDEGQNSDDLAIEVNGQIIQKRFYQREFSANETIHVRQLGGTSRAFVSAYQQYFDPQPEPRSDVFEVQTSFHRADGNEVTTLKYGESARIDVEVTVKKDASYVLIEVPIPAGCGYGNKPSARFPEVHREYFKDRVAIYCTSLYRGVHRFSIPLEARFSGSFTLNPAHVEEMYNPQNFGCNALKRVEITD